MGPTPTLGTIITHFLKLTDMINLIKDESHRNESKGVREVKLSDHVKEEKGAMREVNVMSLFSALRGF